jgi:hypothetical protein
MKTTENLELEELRKANQILQATVVNLQIMNTNLQNTVIDLQNMNNKLQNTVKHLTEQLDWFKRQMFGKKSEKTNSELDHCLIVMPGFENIGSPKEELQNVPEHKRRKPHRDGQDAISLSPDIPVKTTVLDLREQDKICKKTGKPLVKIGEEVTRRLAHTPGSYYIKEIIRPKYAHPEKPEDGVQTAPLPDTLLSNAKLMIAF